MKSLATIGFLALCACAGGVPYERYEARVDENSRLRQKNSSLERHAGENRELRRRIAALERDNAELRAELDRDRSPPPTVGARPPVVVAEPAPTVEPAITAGVDARVIQLEAKSGGTRVTVNRGERDGVERGWILELVDGAGHPVARVRGRVIYVGPTYARALLPVKVKVARRHSQARLTSDR